MFFFIKLITVLSVAQRYILNIFVWLLNVPNVVWLLNISKTRIILILYCSRMNSTQSKRFLLMIYIYFSKSGISIIHISRVCLICFKVVSLKLFFHLVESSLMLKLSWTLSSSLRRNFERNAWSYTLWCLLLKTSSLHLLCFWTSRWLSVISVINYIEGYIDAHYLFEINVILCSKLIKLA